MTRPDYSHLPSVTLRKVQRAGDKALCAIGMLLLIALFVIAACGLLGVNALELLP